MGPPETPVIVAARSEAARSEAARPAADAPTVFPFDAGAAQPATPYDGRAVATAGRVGWLVVVLRWASVGVALLLTPLSSASTSRIAVALVLVGANAIVRTVRPLRVEPATWKAETLLLVDLAFSLAAIALTRNWASPFILTPLPTVVLAAYGWGYREGFATAVLAGAAIAIFDTIAGTSEAAVQSGVLGTMIVLLAAMVGGFTRQLWLDAERRRQETLDQMSRMAVANELLHALHEVVQTLPSSLDLSDVLASARRRFRELFDATAIVVLVHEDAGGTWRVELAEGVRLPDALEDRALPRIVARARNADEDAVTVVDDVDPEDDALFLDGARSALVTPLRARDHVVGIVTIESTDSARYTDDDAQLLAGIASSLALAVDNARWFARLRTLGAEAERARIARDLHDRLAQSLAYVGFELERLAVRRPDEPELRDLQAVVRDVVGELRETLYQLRTTIEEDAGLERVAAAYVRRWSDRTRIPVELVADTGGRRLPIQVEQELWRILQESLTNIERHADATRARVTWAITDGRARLEIADDGRGIDAEGIDRDRFGLLGIRERADAVGASLTLDSGPGSGTRVVVELEVPA